MADTRPWVLHVTRNLPPLRGGMERLNFQLISYLSQDYRVALCGPKGAGERLAENVDVVAASPPYPLVRFLADCATKALLAALRLKPRLVIAGSGLTAPIAWIAARAVRAKVAVYLHGLDIVAPSSLYRALWLPFIRRCDLVLANSSNTARLAVAAGVPAGRTRVVHPGTDLPTLDQASALAFRRAHGFEGIPLLLSVGRLTPRKGLAGFVEHVLPRLVARYADLVLLVIGHEPVDAVNRPQHSERDRVQDAARRAGVEQHLRWLPPCSDSILLSAYQAADVHVFPVVEVAGDVEGFGMVAVEAAACGLPTVAYAVGGVPDAVVDGVTGRLVPSNDTDGFVGAVEEMLSARRMLDWSVTCREASRKFAWPRFGDEVLQAVGAAISNASRKQGG